MVALTHAPVGLYTCTVEWSVEAPVETQYRVEVLVPPSITSVAARGEVREGDAAELECQGGQQPPAGHQGRAYLLELQTKVHTEVRIITE